MLPHVLCFLRISPVLYSNTFKFLVEGLKHMFLIQQAPADSGIVVLLQALGGMAVAVVAKYADNISKLSGVKSFSILHCWHLTNHAAAFI